MKPRPSRYKGVILKKLVVFLREVELFLLQLGRSKEEERLRVVGSFTKAGWKLWRSGNGLWLTYRRSTGKGHLPPGKGHRPSPKDNTTSLTGKVGAFLPLAGMQQGRRMSWLGEKLR